jgi:protocatechuate 3,4-dioxygenase beta subunit
VPEETGGPFPGDGSNGVNVLNVDGVVRTDIRSSFAGLVGEAAGVVLTLKLTVVDASCVLAKGKAVYVWHADKDGAYSLYGNAVKDKNYLRGVQETDENGVATFTTIFPGCYDGRWPHIHFEIYDSVNDAVASSSVQATSQLALPEETCRLAYAAAGYETSVDNLARASLSGDGVFGDGTARQLPEVSGSASAGFVALLTLST